MLLLISTLFIWETSRLNCPSSVWSQSSLSCRRCVMHPSCCWLSVASSWFSGLQKTSGRRPSPDISSEKPQPPQTANMAWCQLVGQRPVDLLRAQTNISHTSPPFGFCPRRERRVFISSPPGGDYVKCSALRTVLQFRNIFSTRVQHISPAEWRGAAALWIQTDMEVCPWVFLALRRCREERMFEEDANSSRRLCVFHGWTAVLQVIVDALNLSSLFKLKVWVQKFHQKIQNRW